MFFGSPTRLGLGDFLDLEGRWLELFQALRPFTGRPRAGIALLVAGLLNSRRVARRKLPQPALLTAGDEARRVGMDEAELIAARTPRRRGSH